MAETTKNKNSKYKAQDTSSKNKTSSERRTEVESVGTLLEGFTPTETSALARVKKAVARGEYSDLTPEFKKLLFVKWLVEHDRIGS